MLQYAHVRVRSRGMLFNKVDRTGDKSIDRTSFLGKYEVVDGLPRCFQIKLIYMTILTLLGSNPTGRTGFAGRGLLERWGPNHCVDPIFSRFVGTNKT